MKSHPWKRVLAVVRAVFFVAAVLLAIGAIWAPENRIKLALTAIVILCALGLWLAVERTNPHDKADASRQSVEQPGPGHRPNGP